MASASMQSSFPPSPLSAFLRWQDTGSVGARGDVLFMVLQDVEGYL